jgi:hypothetical protein
MATTRYHCPVDNCRWYIDENEDVVQGDVLRQSLGMSVLQHPSKTALIDQTEARLQEHLAMHTPLQFMITIARLNDENARLRAAAR